MLSKQFVRKKGLKTGEKIAYYFQVRMSFDVKILITLLVDLREHMKSSDAKASKCHLKFSSRMIIFIKLVFLSSVISLKWQ